MAVLKALLVVFFLLVGLVGILAIFGTSVCEIISPITTICAQPPKTPRPH